ncbi:MAG TPA: amidohydrolase [Ktedonobacteraceae bacterium]|nr:amidohydrolase [Ktedonobacteraceae bacterium]
MGTILYLNGNIYTMDAAQPRAQAMAIDTGSGYILAVGTNDEVRRLGGQHTELVDLRRRTVLPGFIDAHIHLLGAAYRAHHIDAGGCSSEDEVASLVHERAVQTPEGHWILGGQWDKNRWTGGNFPDKASLDAVAPGHPVALWSKDGHLLWVNSLALQRAGITAETPEPANGAILRDGSGEPTGILQEQEATNLVYSVIDQSSDAALTRMLVQRILKELQKSGITTIHDIEGMDALRLFQQLRDEGELGVRVQMILPRQVLPELRETWHPSTWHPQGITYPPDRVPFVGAEGFDDMLGLGGIKIFADGTLGSQTAAMLESFEGSPNNYGILTLSEQEMNETVSAAAEMGLSIAIHAIGDRAAHVALNSIEKAQQHLAGNSETSRDLSSLRYRLEHVQLITPEDLERMRRLGVVASVQPFHAVADRDIAERYWGKRHRRAYAYRTIQQMGIPLALGSDAPVETFDPLRILYAATMRRDDTSPQRPPWLPDQALPVAQALWGYTLGAAYAGAEEKRKGSLTAGKLGDAVVLRENILDVPQDKMAQNGVQATILGGKIVYGEV